MSLECAQIPIKPKDLGRWKLIADFQQRLRGIAERIGIASTFSDPKRQLHMEEYLGLFLFGLLNPAVRTMRALCGISHRERIFKEICRRPVSLGSFSEMQAVIDPALLHAVFYDLVKEIHPGSKTKQGSKEWFIIDSTLWEILPRMHWALWRHQGGTQNAVRLHLGLHILDDKPAKAIITPGRTCERKAWQELWEDGDAYVGDRYYGEDYKLFKDLDERGCAFVLRLRDEATIDIDEELPLSDADRKANVIRQASQ